jgi:hypothetical protein
MLEKKAAKCIRVARALLGSKATEASVEDQALDIMDWSDSALNSTLTRLAGGFMAADEDPMVACGMMAEEEEDDLDALMAEMDVVDPEGVPAVPAVAGMDDILAKMASLEAQIRKLADQNDPEGETLAPKPKEEDEARKPEKQAALSLWASMDTHGDGFVTAEDWKGSRSLFAAIDTDHDGIISKDEMMTALSKKAEDEEEKEEEKKEEEPKDAGKKAADEEEPKPWEKKDEDEKEEPKDAGKKAQCMDMDDMGLGDEDGYEFGEGDMMGDVVLDDDDALLAEIFGGKRASKKADEDEEGEDSEGETEDEEAEEEEDEPKDAKKKASGQKPQPRKPSQGVRQIGQMTRSASATGEDLADLSRLWQSSPDVSHVFNGGGNN